MVTLINLIGGQNIPNLIAQKFIIPQKIILLYSKGSIKQKEYYKSVVRDMNIEEREINAYNYYSIKNEIKNILIENKGGEFILNFTGGTKIMSLACFNVFKEMNYQSIYIDSENSKIYKFNNSELNVESMNIKITAEEYLKLNGHIYKIEVEKTIDDSKKAYYEFLENNFNPLIGKFLHEINDRYELNKQEFYNNNVALKNKNFKYKWDNNRRASIISINNDEFEIKGKDSIKYITGMWFEDLVYYKKFKHTSIYDEVIRNVHIKDRSGKQDMIELDIIALYQNNFHLFELKSSKPRRETLNNLRTIKEQLGTYTKLFLVSYFNLDENDPLVDRMQDLGIRFFNYFNFQIEKCIEPSNINL